MKDINISLESDFTVNHIIIEKYLLNSSWYKSCVEISIFLGVVEFKNVDSYKQIGC